jgi:hypothetical protein
MPMRFGFLDSGLRDLCKWVKDRGFQINSVVDVGSHAGESAFIFSEEFPNASVYGIDPWKAGYDNADPASQSQYALDVAEEAFDQLVYDFPKIHKLKGTSSDFSSNPALQSVDFVYIDGCHTSECVASDIAFWKNRAVHILAGHDFTWSPTVSAAVIKALGNPHATFADSSWLFRKDQMI